VIGFICNLLVRPVAQTYYMSAEPTPAGGESRVSRV
jgi:hypothetical protein